MFFFKEGRNWRRMKANGVSLFRVHLDEKMTEKQVRSIDLANLLGVSPSIITVWSEGKERPPDDIQWLITLYLGCKSRDEIWEFRADLFPEIQEMAKLQSALSKVEDKLRIKLKENDNE